MANTKLHVYFDQGGMFGKGNLFLSETKLDEPSLDTPMGNIANYYFCEVTEYYHKSCLHILLSAFDEKWGLITLKGSLHLDVLGPKQY